MDISNIIEAICKFKLTDISINKEILDEFSRNSNFIEFKSTSVPPSFVGLYKYNEDRCRIFFENGITVAIWYDYYNFIDTNADDVLKDAESVFKNKAFW